MTTASIGIYSGRQQHQVQGRHVRAPTGNARGPNAAAHPGCCLTTRLHRTGFGRQLHHHQLSGGERSATPSRSAPGRTGTMRTLAPTRPTPGQAAGSVRRSARKRSLAQPARCQLIARHACAPRPPRAPRGPPFTASGHRTAATKACSSFREQAPATGGRACAKRPENDSSPAALLRLGSRATD